MALFNITAEDSSPLISYSPSSAWEDTPLNDPLISSYSGSSFHTTTSQDATATINFNGTGIWIFGGGRPSYGSYSLEIDGQVVFNGSSKPSSDFVKQLLCSASGLAFGSHTAILRNTDGAPIDIDFIDFETQLGQPESTLSVTNVDDSSPQFSYLPSASDWMTNNIPTYINGTLHYTQVPGAYASMNFTGDAMVLYGTVSPDHANIRLTIDGRDVSIPGGSGGTVSGLRPQVLLYYSNNLGSGQHTVNIADDTEAGTGKFLDIDSIQVLSTAPLSNTPTSSIILSGSIITSSTIPSSVSTSAIPSTLGSKRPDSSPIASSQPTSHSPHAGVIVGAVIASISVVGLILLLLFFLRRRKLRKKQVTIGPEFNSPLTPPLPMQRAPRSPLTTGFKNQTPAPPQTSDKSRLSVVSGTSNLSRNMSVASVYSTDSLIRRDEPQPVTLPIPRKVSRKAVPTVRFGAVTTVDASVPKRPARRPPSLKLGDSPV